MTVEHQGQMLGRITVSAGVACFPEHGTTADELLRAGDTALYRAKQLGRDRVEAYESRPSMPVEEPIEPTAVVAPPAE